MVKVNLMVNILIFLLYIQLLPDCWRTKAGAGKRFPELLSGKGAGLGV